MVSYEKQHLDHRHLILLMRYKYFRNRTKCAMIVDLAVLTKAQNASKVADTKV